MIGRDQFPSILNYRYSELSCSFVALRILVPFKPGIHFLSQIQTNATANGENLLFLLAFARGREKPADAAFHNTPIVHLLS